MDFTLIYNETPHTIALAPARLKLSTHKGNAFLFLNAAHAEVLLCLWRTAAGGAVSLSCVAVLVFRAETSVGGVVLRLWRTAVGGAVSLRLQSHLRQLFPVATI